MDDGFKMSRAVSAVSKFVKVDGITTHYLEAGSGYPLVLLHSGEFGACAELSWEFNIEALSRHFRVLAPDWLGYGKTEKLFDFRDMRTRRIDHIAAFLRTLCIDSAHFVGNSMGATVLLEVAAMNDGTWPLDRVVSVCGGGVIPMNKARDVLNSYDGSYEHMERMVGVLVTNPALRTNPAYIERRHLISLEPGAWECTAAARFRRNAAPASGMTRNIAYHNIGRATLLVVGQRDPLREPGYAGPIKAAITAADLHVMTNSGHCPNIDEPDAFNRVVIDFLTRQR